MHDKLNQVLSILNRLVGPVRIGLLLCALVLPALWLDASGVPSALWWTAILALMVGVFAVLADRLPPLGWRYLALIALITLPAVMRVTLSLRGPLPVHGLREAYHFSAIGTAAVALWLIASERPVQAWWIWLVALAFGFLRSVIAAGRLSADDPSQWATGLTCAFGLAIAVWLWCRQLARKRLREKAQKQGRQDACATMGGKHRIPFLMPNLTAAMALLAGLALGWSRLGELEGLPMLSALEVDHALRIQDRLWMQSVLFGWGPGATDSLTRVLAAPHPIVMPQWCGPLSLMAQVGLLGLAALIVWAAVLVRRLAQPRTAWNAAAAVCALFLVGLIVAGGPRRPLVLFILAGWSALAVTTKPATRSAPVPLRRWLPSTVAGVALFGLICVLWFPVHSEGLRRAAAIEPAGSSTQRLLLARASRSNPFDPAVALDQARAWKESMAEYAEWSETIYRRTVELYRRTEALDPFDTSLPFELSRFQLEVEREEDAIQTVNRALERIPNATNLIDWMFVTAIARDRSPLAHQMLDRGLLIEPNQLRWWIRRFDLTHALGQGPLSAQSMSIALTDHPENIAMVRAAWSASAPTGNETPGPSPSIPHSLVDSPDISRVDH